MKKGKPRVGDLVVEINRKQRKESRRKGCVKC